MSNAFRQFWVVLIGVLTIPLASAVDPGEGAFLEENREAMQRMMSEMRSRPAGDVDRDFVAMMTPHHQGAIDMARAELRYGRNEQLRRIAQEIIIDQQQEIVAMQLAVRSSDPLVGEINGR